MTTTSQQTAAPSATHGDRLARGQTNSGLASTCGSQSSANRFFNL